MDITRRDFLKWSGAAGAGLFVASLGFDLSPIEAYAQANPPFWTKTALTICNYCSLGCGMIACCDASTGLVTHIEGDPDHPINGGALCSKGSASAQFSTVLNEVNGELELNPKRLTKPLYREANDDKWVEKDWSWMIDTIAERIKTTRAAGFVDTETVPEGIITVNRCENIGFVGGAGLNNETCYLLVKLMRALGLVYIEHQARI